MKIGVISDTHGYFNPFILIKFYDVDLILHAGDIGKMSVLHKLGEIAPTEAVYGNTDPDVIRELTEEAKIMELCGYKIALCHGAGSYHDIIERLHTRFKAEKADIVIYGHTHEPDAKTVDGIYFFNPGCGKNTAGLLEIDESGGFSTRIVNLK